MNFDELEASLTLRNLSHEEKEAVIRLIKLAVEEATKLAIVMCSDLVHEIRKVEGDSFCKTCGKRLP